MILNEEEEEDSGKHLGFLVSPALEERSRNTYWTSTHNGQGSCVDCCAIGVGGAGRTHVSVVGRGAAAKDQFQGFRSLCLHTYIRSIAILVQGQGQGEPGSGNGSGFGGGRGDGCVCYREWVGAGSYQNGRFSLGWADCEMLFMILLSSIMEYVIHFQP